MLFKQLILLQIKLQIKLQEEGAIDMVISIQVLMSN